ncbi:MAG: DUF192 domain-containing protein [Chloroflexi bacterium]|nr:DUF192 domain-containing protein [Chloroflexota bacterium]
MPRTLQVFNRSQNTKLVTSGVVADNPWARLVGLMGKRSLPDGFGLLLRNEAAIHTFGMRIPIDVVYLDRVGIIVRITETMPPARFGPLVRGARDVLELPAGTLSRTHTRVGDQLELNLS